MARGINKVILIGHLGADPELRHMPNGNPVVTINLATSEVWKDKQTGEQQERTEWHRVVLFQGLAKITHDHLKKGSKIFIEGRLQTRKWKEKGYDGQERNRYITEIIASEMHMLDSRTTSSLNNAAPYENDKLKKETNLEPEAALESFDDDIPF